MSKLYRMELTEDEIIDIVAKHFGIDPLRTTFIYDVNHTMEVAWTEEEKNKYGFYY